MTLVLRFWRELLIVILGLICYLQFKYRPEEKPPRVEVVEKVVFKDKIVYRDRVVVRDRVITKPDGTKIEERTQTDTKERTEEHSKERIVGALPRYQLGIGLDPIALAFDRQHIYSLDAGIRLGGTPFFFKVNPSYNFSTRQFQGIVVGLTVEF